MQFQFKLASFLRTFDAGNSCSNIENYRFLPSKMTDCNPGFRTVCVHADHKVATEAAIAPSISVSTTFDMNAGGTDVYSRMSSSTRRRTEEVLGNLEMQKGMYFSAEFVQGHVTITQRSNKGKGAFAVTYGSGLAACFAAVSYFNPKRIAIYNGYHGTHMVINAFKRLKSGIVSVVDLKETKQFQEGDLLWIETPLNPTCELFNISDYAERAQAVGAKVVVDGTFAPPPLQFPLELGADMVMHSATKFLGGHSDLLVGVLAVKNEDTKQRLIEERTALGAVPGSLEVWLLLRSLRTLQLRVMQQSKSAYMIATKLEGILRGNGLKYEGVSEVDCLSVQALVEKIYYPSLSLESKEEQERTWVYKQMPQHLGFGGIFSLQLKTKTQAESFVKSLYYWKDATSLGYRWDITVHPGLLRLSCGLENEEDLVRDLLQAAKSVYESEQQR